MKLSEMYPSNLLKAADVTDAGGEMELTIDKIEIKEFDVDNGKERKPIIHFAEGKQMVCNKTNGNLIAEMYGDETDGWLGKKVTLIVQEVDFAGKRTPAIRIKNLNSKEAAIQAYWLKAKGMGFSREEGVAHLKEHGGDFVKALAGLDGPF
jgi:hypothetical protein